MLLCRTRKDSDLILRFSVAQPLQLLFFGAVSCFRCIRFNFEATICLRGAELYPRRCLFASLSYEQIFYIATPRQFRARSTLRSPARHGFPGEPAFKLMRALSLAVRRLRARTTDAAKRYGAMGSARSSCLWYAGWCAFICHRSLMISPYPNDESCGNDQCRTSILIAHLATSRREGNCSWHLAHRARGHSTTTIYILRAPSYAIGTRRPLCLPRSSSCEGRRHTPARQVLDLPSYCDGSSP